MALQVHFERGVVAEPPLAPRVVVGSGSGELRNAHEFTIRDGMSVRFKVYGDQDEALEAAGLSE